MYSPLTKVRPSQRLQLNGGGNDSLDNYVSFARAIIS